MPSCAKLQACLQQLKHYWPGRFSQRHAATLPWLEDRNRHNVSQPIGSMYVIYGNIYHQYTPNVSIYTIHGSYGQCHTMSKCVDVGFERCGAQFLSHGRRSKMPRSEVSTEVDDWFVAFSGLLNINLHIIIDIMYIYIHMYILLKFDFLLFLELTFLNGTTVKCCPNFDLWFLPKISEEIEEACLVSLTQFTKAPPLTPPVLQNITKGLARVLGRRPW